MFMELPLIMNSQILSLRGHAGEEQQLLRIFNLNEVAPLIPLHTSASW